MSLPPYKTVVKALLESNAALTEAILHLKPADYSNYMGIIRRNKMIFWELQQSEYKVDANHDSEVTTSP